MKSILILILAVFVSVGTYSQNTERSSKSDEMVPAVYKTDQMQNLEEISVQSRSEITLFIEKELEYPEISLASNDEGEVVVEFHVTENGELSDIKVLNSVSRQLDYAVVECLTRTHGNWTPAMAYGQPVASTQTLHVIFDIPGNPPLTERAQDKLDEALQRINRAEEIQASSLSEDKRNRKANNNYKIALSLLEDASKFSANQNSIVFWEARTYEALGDMTMMQSKIDELSALENNDTDENKLLVRIGL